VSSHQEPYSDAGDAWPVRGRPEDARQPREQSTELPPYMVMSGREKDKRLERARRRVVYGVLWVIAGILLSLFISSRGGTFIVVYWGMMLYGVISALWNVRTIVRNREPGP
jgi:hypothetical protein